MNDGDTIWWRFGEEFPTTKLAVTNGIVRDTLIPRTLAWMSVHDDDDDENGQTTEINQAKNVDFCCLLDGYTAACYTPPILFFAESVLPPCVANLLRKTRQCTLSAVTTRDPITAIHKASSTTTATTKGSHSKQAFTFSELGLQPVESPMPNFPRAIATSPLHMYCSLTRIVEVDKEEQNNNNDAKNASMILLTVEKFVMDTSILSAPPSELSSNSQGRTILAKIDAARISPMVGLGCGRTCPVSIFRSMPRPSRQQEPESTTNDNNNIGTWTSTDFDHPVIRSDDPVDLSSIFVSDAMSSSTTTKIHRAIEWNFRTDGRACILGYNPTTALIAPRPIGWISTYSRNHRIAHLAPYSFFIDVHDGDILHNNNNNNNNNNNIGARITHPMVAFSAFVKQDGDGNRRRKDAHKDAEETRCFCFNMPTRDLAVALNYSAAELKREESEFELAGLAYEPARYVDAPVVRDAPIHYECEYVQTIDDVGGFSIVIGKVVAVAVHEKILTDGKIDVNKLRPIMRLGFTDEYCVL